MAEPTPDNVAIIVLAAGSSSRLGQPKQLLKIGNDSLLRKTILTALALKAGSTIIVLGHRASEFKNEIADLPIIILENKDWAKGMGSSIKSGISFLKNNTTVQAAIILTCDQPFLTSNHLLELWKAYLNGRKIIAASRYSNSIGIPALFDQNLFDRLLSIDDQQGAKAVIQENKENIISIDFHDGEIDLDTPEDYRAYLQLIDKRKNL